MENEKNVRTGTAYKPLLIIPVVVFVLGVILFIIGSLLEFPTHRGVVYGICIMLSLLGFAFNVFPGGILAIIGTILAAKAKKTKYLALGIVEILSSLVGAYLIWYVIFVTGPSV